ncbi:hypothetical protein, partial [Sunxiuqinia dokdonensis]|uniref:hypothetical protein n=1 Tax=Sunxiuqinia dokdonensis TaxID=1409788 RepID=UPI0019558D54
MALKYFFSPWNGTLAPALHFIIRAGMCGEWLNWFSFLIFDENNLRLKFWCGRARASVARAWSEAE